MIAKRAFLASGLAWFLTGTLAAQPTATPLPAPQPAPPVGMPAMPMVVDTAVQLPTPGERICCDRPGADCCGPVGGNGPIQTEIYSNTGIALVLGGNTFARNLNAGWRSGIGGKTLFYDNGGAAAWVLDTGLTYTYNNGTGSDVFNLNGNNVTISGLHRTAAQVGLGRDWYLNGPGFITGPRETNLSYGIDAGGRYGTAHVDLNRLAGATGPGRQHKVFGGYYVGVHANWEYPEGAWTYLAGIRAEYSYSFMDFIPGSSNGVHDASILLQAGIRY